MKDELRNKLTDKYPSLFREADKPHFDCGDGWYDLLDRLFARLTETKLPTDYKIVTVKEKYAGLNVWGYSDLEPEESWWVRDIIGEFEQESYSTCEQCGSTTGVQFYSHEGWDQVGCYPCRQKVKSGWRAGDPPHEHQQHAESMLGRFITKFDEEVASVFPEGTTVKIVLHTNSEKSCIVVKTPDGKVCAV